MKLAELYPSKWLKAADLEGQQRLVTIEAVKLETVEDGKPPKPVIALRGLTQGLVLNKVNATTLAGFLGDDTDHWPGQRIVIFPTQATFKAELVDCIRVRQPKPQPAPAAPRPPAPVPQRPGKPVGELPAPLPVPNEDDVPF